MFLNCMKNILGIICNMEIELTSGSKCNSIIIRKLLYSDIRNCMMWSISKALLRLWQILYFKLHILNVNSVSTYRQPHDSMSIHLLLSFTLANCLCGSYSRTLRLLDCSHDNWIYLRRHSRQMQRHCSSGSIIQMWIKFKITHHMHSHLEGYWFPIRAAVAQSLMRWIGN